MNRASTLEGDPADSRRPMQAGVFGEIDRERGSGVAEGAADASTRPSTDPAAIAASSMWIEVPEKPRPAPPSVEERSAQDLAIEILRSARQEVLASANPCAIESPFIVARRAKRILEDRVEAGAARDAVDAAIERLVDRI
ncbi:MAG: hypothetical protein ACO3SJ_01050 [Phycisphaerales bacterium]